MRFVANGFFLIAALFATAASPEARAESEILYYSSAEPAAPARPGIGAPKHDRLEVPFSYGHVRPFMTFMREKKWMKDYIAKDLKGDVIAFLRSDELRGLREASQRRWEPFATIPLEDFIADLRASKIESRGHCRDETKKRDGTAAFDDRGGTICLAPKRLIARENFWFEPNKKALLFGLTIHEVLHHFGYWDADDALYGHFTMLALQYLTKTLPAPARVKVSDDFRAWREEVREGVQPKLAGGTAKFADCRLETIEDATNAGTFLAVAPKLREFFRGEIRVDRSPGLDENVFLVSGGLTSSDDVAFPRVLRQTTLPSQDLWVFNPLRVGTESVYLIARSAKNGDLVFEIGRIGDEIATPVMLPSAVPNKSRPFGYARCTPARAT